MGVCYGPLVWLWVTAYVIIVALTPKRYRLYSVNGIIIAAALTRFLAEGVNEALTQSGGAMAILAIIINVAIWADNTGEARG